MKIINATASLRMATAVEKSIKMKDYAVAILDRDGTVKVAWSHYSVSDQAMESAVRAAKLAVANPAADEGAIREALKESSAFLVHDERGYLVGLIGIFDLDKGQATLKIAETAAAAIGCTVASIGGLIGQREDAVL